MSKRFIKYMIHFLMISGILYGLVCCLTYFDVLERNNVKLVPIAIGLAVYTVVMAVAFAIWSRPQTAIYVYQTEQEKQTILKLIEDYCMTKLGRKPEKRLDNYLLFYPSNRYAKWLGGKIEVIVLEGIKLKAPALYARKMSQLIGKRNSEREME